MVTSSGVEEAHHGPTRDHRPFDWGLFSLFALFSLGGAVLVILDLAFAD